MPGYDIIDSAFKGTIAANGAIVVIGPVYGVGTIGLDVSGNLSGTLQFEESLDNNTWYAASGIPQAGGSGVTSTVANGAWFFAFGGYRYFRVRCSAFTSGSATIYITGAAAIQSLGSGGGSGSAPVTSEITLLASAARTVTTQSSDQTNTTGTYLQIIMAITSLTGGASLQLRILGKNPITGVYDLLNAAQDGSVTAPMTATGEYIFQLGPGCVSSGGSILQTTAAMLPKTWAIEVVPADNKSVTYSVAAVVGV